MAFRVRITTGSSAPIYKQIADQVRLAVARGELRPGDRMPSVRAQAESLVVNPNTVARAYGDLVREDVLRSEQGRGVFVNGIASGYTKAERKRRMRPTLEAFVNEAVALGISGAEVRALLGEKLAAMKLDDAARRRRRGRDDG